MRGRLVASLDILCQITSVDSLEPFIKRAVIYTCLLNQHTLVGVYSLDVLRFDKIIRLLVVQSVTLFQCKFQGFKNHSSVRKNMFSGYYCIDNYYNFLMMLEECLCFYLPFYRLLTKHKPSVSRPQVFHVVCSTRLGEKGLEPFYWSCALWVLKITALQPREGQTINCKSLYCIAKSKKIF